MHSKSFKLGNTIFQLNSEMEIFDSKLLQPFAVDSDGIGYQFKIRWAEEGEETPDCYGHMLMEKVGEDISLALNTEKDFIPSTGQLFSLLPVIRLLLEKDTLILHASYVLYKGRAILFCGPSQVGKSTQASLWESYRSAEVINGDRTLLFFKDGQVYAGGFYNSGTSGICKNKTVPIAAIILLRQGKENQVQKVGGVEAFRELLVQSAYDTQKREEIELVTSLVANIIACTNVLRFTCKKDETAVIELEKYI